MDSFSEVWQEVKNLCKTQMTEVAYNIWIDPIEAVKFDGDTAVLQTNTDFKKSIILTKYSTLLTNAFSEVFGFPVKVDIIVGQTIPEKKPMAKEEDKEEFTFENFVVGSSNQFAYAACRRVATVPGVEYNPLLIYGRSGLGKTHLMLAICSELKKNNPNAAILYITSETFTTELISCIAEKNVTSFHNKYRNVDALLIDDIQFIQGKQATQEEFFHTFNALSQAGKQIVLTSDRPPKDMPVLEDRLRTRLEEGLMADVQPPDIDTRMAIVKRKSEEMGLELSDTVIEYIAEKIKNNIRQLEGIVKRMHALQTLHNTKPSLQLAQEVLQDFVNDSKPVGEVVKGILESVSKFYGVSVADIESNKRNANINIARQTAMYMIRYVTDLPLKEIGDYFSGRSHATVHHGITELENKMEYDPKFKNDIQDLIKNLESSGF